MGGLSKVRPEDRIIAYCRRIHAKVSGDETGDVRLSEAQRYAGVLDIIKCDPAILCAKVINLCMDKRSKWEVDTYTLHRMIVDLHHMVSASPDYRTRKRDAEENQFELDFEWHVEGNSAAADKQIAARELKALTGGVVETVDQVWQD